MNVSPYVVSHSPRGPVERMVVQVLSPDLPLRLTTIRSCCPLASGSSRMWTGVSYAASAKPMFMASVDPHEGLGVKYVLRMAAACVANVLSLSTTAFRVL